MSMDENPAQGKTQQKEKEFLLTIVFCGPNIYGFREIRIFQFITSSLDFFTLGGFLEWSSHGRDAAIFCCQHLSEKTNK